MNKLLSAFLFVISVGAVLQGYLFVAALFAVWFSFQTSALWLIPVAFLVDGYFGAFYDVPWLSLSTILLFVITELARPYFTWHAKETI